MSTATGVYSYAWTIDEEKVHSDVYPESTYTKKGEYSAIRGEEARHSHHSELGTAWPRPLDKENRETLVWPT